MITLCMSCGGPRNTVPRDICRQPENHDKPNKDGETPDVLVYENANVTRITVVGPSGVEFEQYDLYPAGVEIHVQDGGRTLKVFPRHERRT